MFVNQKTLKALVERIPSMERVLVKIYLKELEMFDIIKKMQEAIVNIGGDLNAAVTENADLRKRNDALARQAEKDGETIAEQAALIEESKVELAKLAAALEAVKDIIPDAPAPDPDVNYSGGGMEE